MAEERKDLGVAEFTEGIRQRVGENSNLGASIKFAFDEGGVIFIDGKSVPNVVTNEDSPADVTLKMSLNTMNKLYRKETNGMMAFGLVGLAFIGNWVEQIGTLADNDAARYVGTVASLIMPNEALWQLAASHMQPTMLRELGQSPFSPLSVPSTAMLWWTAGYIAVALALGLRAFRNRAL